MDIIPLTHFIKVSNFWGGPLEEIKYFNRENGQFEIEQVYGDKMVRWLYDRPEGQALGKILCHPLFSRAYGKLQDSSASKGKINTFVKEFNIPLDEYLPEEGRSASDPYSTFNNFFIRRFKPGAREFVSDRSTMPAFCEARYFGVDQVKLDTELPLKGKYLSPILLVENDKWGETFIDGPLLIARLCPVDYHRFHYPDGGKVLDHYRVQGKLHSVNPVALKYRPNILISNERQVTILETENFGKLAYIEVGAICVGKIVQSSDLKTFKRGEEKGYFLFGGSTVVLIGERGKWRPSEDILRHTSEGVETYLKLGDEIGKKL